MGGLLNIFNLRIGYGCITHRTPVYYSRTFVNKSLVVQVDKDFRNSLVTAFIHRKAFPLPVT